MPRNQKFNIFMESTLNKYRRFKSRLKMLIKRVLFHDNSGIEISDEVSEVYPVEFIRSSSDRVRINLLIPSINSEHMFGGIATAIDMFEAIKAKIGPNAQYRIVITNSIPNASALSAFSEYKMTKGHDDSDCDLQIISLYEQKPAILPIAKNGIYIATAWWTAHLAQRIVKAQKDLFRSETLPYLYLIQDYEPGFYPWGIRYMVTQQTYKQDVPVIAIFNTNILQEYFNRHGYHFYQEYHFQPRISQSLRKLLPNPRSKKKKKIIVYGRPNVPRNDFYTIVQGLRFWIENDPKSEEWEIVSAGEMHPNIELKKGRNLVSTGKLTLTEYGKLLKESAIGISIMISPHPSYPPLEMIHFGLMTITNTFENKDLTKWHENIYNLDPYSPERLAELLKELTAKFEEDRQIGFKAKSMIPFYLSEDNNFDFIDDLAKKLGKSIGRNILEQQK